MKILHIGSLTSLKNRFFRELEGLNNLVNPLATKISYVSGSVETACALGLADAIGNYFKFIVSGFGRKW